jgi:hypothetical protein
MRLLNTTTLEFHEFASPDDAPPYIITSHRWLDGEVSYQEFMGRGVDSRVDEKPGMNKIKQFCKFIKDWQASRESIAAGRPCTALPRYIWIDTCCINKQSSAELQEAITSMYQYYAKAWCCIAYLHDVKTRSCSPLAILQSFKESIWFTRGWTLQELLAPSCVIFVDQDWYVFGHKSAHHPLMIDEGNAVGVQYLKMPLNPWISQATGIDEAILWDYNHAQHVSFEDRLAWMNKRTTTRAEDRAYCMLGLCEVYMPLIYGEGSNAMKRLYREIREEHGITVKSTHSPMPRGDKRGSQRHRSDQDVSGSGMPPDSQATEPTTDASRDVVVEDLLNNYFEYYVWSDEDSRPEPDGFVNGYEVLRSPQFVKEGIRKEHLLEFYHSSAGQGLDIRGDLFLRWIPGRPVREEDITPLQQSGPDSGDGLKNRPAVPARPSSKVLAVMNKGSPGNPDSRLGPAALPQEPFSHGDGALDESGVVPFHQSDCIICRDMFGHTSCDRRLPCSNCSNANFPCSYDEDNTASASQQNLTDLETRIQEAKTSAEILLQLMQSSAPEDLRTNELGKEFLDRCYKARKLMGFYHLAFPGDVAAHAIHETDIQLLTAIETYEHALKRQHNDSHAASNSGPDEAARRFTESSSAPLTSSEFRASDCEWCKCSPLKHTTCDRQKTCSACQSRNFMCSYDEDGSTTPAAAAPPPPTPHSNPTLEAGIVVANVSAKFPGRFINHMAGKPSPEATQRGDLGLNASKQHLPTFRRSQVSSDIDCNECHDRRADCSRDRPRCARCVRGGLSCFYTPPRSRKANQIQ